MYEDPIHSTVSSIPSLSLSSSHISLILSPSLSGFPEAVASQKSTLLTVTDNVAGLDVAGTGLPSKT